MYGSVPPLIFYKGPHVKVHNCDKDNAPYCCLRDCSHNYYSNYYSIVNGESMSMHGMEAASHENETTMVLNLSRDDEDYRQFVVVHEFGHALGLGHEHQTSHFADDLDPDATIQWIRRTSRVSSERAKDKFDTDFKAKSEAVPEEFGMIDTGSVMCYP